MNSYIFLSLEFLIHSQIRVLHESGGLPLRPEYIQPLLNVVFFFTYIYFVFGVTFYFPFLTLFKENKYKYVCLAIKAQGGVNQGDGLYPFQKVAAWIWRSGRNLHGIEVWNPLFFSSLLLKEVNILCSATVWLKNKLIQHVPVKEVFTWAWYK